MHLVLFDKPGCHLCDVARATVEGVLASTDRAVRFERVDVRTDPALLDLYRLDVPVLAIDGTPAFRHHVDPARLRDRIEHGRPAPLEEPARA